MNGVPVYPVSQNGERPYPEGRKVAFSTPGWWQFSAPPASETYLFVLAVLLFQTTRLDFNFHLLCIGYSFKRYSTGNSVQPTTLLYFYT